MLLILAYIFLRVVYWVLGISSAGLESSFPTVKFFYFYAVFIPVRRYLTANQRNVILITALFGYLYTVLQNARYAATNYHYVLMFLLESDSNAANTAYSTTSMLFGGAMLILFFFTQKRSVKIFSLVLVLASFYFVIFISRRGIAFFLSLLMIILILINRNPKGRKIIPYIFLISLSILIIAFESSIVTMISSLADLFPPRLAARIRSVMVFLMTNSASEAGGSFDARLELTMRSVNTFLSSPLSFLFGVGDHRSNNLIIGNHSLWIDSLARYGILGSSLLFYTIYKMINATRRAFEKDGFFYREITVLFLLFVIRGFLGTVIEPSIGAVLFVVIPLIFDSADQISIQQTLQMKGIQ